MKLPVWFMAALLIVFPLLALAQTAESGIDVPVTLSAGAMYTERPQFSNPNASPRSAGFQAMLYPTLRLGQHWFAYGAVKVARNPYVYYDAFHPKNTVETEFLQAFAGYSIETKRTAILIKAGQLLSAFGAFPSRYDDARNALLDQPLIYITTLTLRADQLPCGTADLQRQFYGSVSHLCGGAPGRTSGLVPATLYGLPGVEVDLASGRVDARVQLTSSSPISAARWVTDTGHYLQWSAGAGYTILQGFRVGVSGFQGPYLERRLTPLLPPGTSVRDFPASAFGFDATWARGGWSSNGEWQHFRFESPNFVVSPSLNSGYVEGKRVITPRLYVAGRAAFLTPGRVVDKAGITAAQYAARLQSYEAAGGYWLARNLLVKGSYEWLKTENRTGTRSNVLGVQLVMTMNKLTFPFH